MVRRSAVHFSERTLANTLGKARVANAKQSYCTDSARPTLGTLGKPPSRDLYWTYTVIEYYSSQCLRSGGTHGALERRAGLALRDPLPGDSISRVETTNDST